VRAGPTPATGPTLSTHVLDTERGLPAAGVPVELSRDGQSLAQAETDADGRIADLAGGPLGEGQYQLAFDVAAYFRVQGRQAPFLQRVSIEFLAQAVDRHYHVPLLLSPYACTSYRGS
jgi:5-hydroxyisourate hydrolase